MQAKVRGLTKEWRNLTGIIKETEEQQKRADLIRGEQERLRPKETPLQRMKREAKAANNEVKPLRKELEKIEQLRKESAARLKKGEFPTLDIKRAEEATQEKLVQDIASKKAQIQTSFRQARQLNKLVKKQEQEDAKKRRRGRPSKKSTIDKGFAGRDLNQQAESDAIVLKTLRLMAEEEKKEAAKMRAEAMKEAEERAKIRSRELELSDLEGTIHAERAAAIEKEIQLMEERRTVSNERMTDIENEVALMHVHNTTNEVALAVGKEQIKNLVKHGKLSKQAAKERLKAEMQALAIQHGVESASHAAFAIGSAAFGNWGKAGMHTAAMIKHGVVATMAGGAASMISTGGGGGGASDTASRRGSGGAGRRGDPEFEDRAPRNFTIIVNTNQLLSNKQDVGDAVIDALNASSVSGNRLPDASVDPSAGNNAESPGP